MYGSLNNVINVGTSPNPTWPGTGEIRTAQLMAVIVTPYRLEDLREKGSYVKPRKAHGNH